jgi:hypothetical protein
MKDLIRLHIAQAKAASDDAERACDAIVERRRKGEITREELEREMAPHLAIFLRTVDELERLAEAGRREHRRAQDGAPPHAA